MASRGPNLDSKDWSNLESRWQITIEDYYFSTSLQGESKIPWQAYAVYGELETMGRVLFFVVFEKKTTLYANEVIEACLDDMNPSLAADLKRDINILTEILSFSSCEVVTRLKSPQKES